MTPALQHNVASVIAIATSIMPVAATANINGASIDRIAHNLPVSCVLHQAVGAAAGAPTSFSVQTKLQSSPDNQNWTDYVQPGATSVAQTVAAAASGEATIGIDLSSAHRFIRAVSLVSFVGGTSPSVPVIADIVLGGEQLRPAV